ncbi:MAG: metallophosphoesterase [Pseudomonadota bacterium]
MNDSSVPALRVAHITDIHLTCDPGEKLYDIADTGLALEQTVRALRDIEPAPAIVIATGDISEDGSAETYERFKTIISALSVPVFTLAGNHDCAKTMRARLNDANCHYTTATEFGGWRFIFVHSQVEGQSHGFVTDDEMLHLQTQLREDSHLPTIVALHHTPTAVCPSTGCQLHNAADFIEQLKQFPQVKAVLAGHTHLAREFANGSLTEFTTPAVFAHVEHAQLGDPVDHEDFWDSHNLDGSKQGFRTLDLYPGGQIDTQVHWV